jgi:16S rRNA processing protein RimM
MTERHTWIEAGAVVRPHGIRGEVIVDLKRDLLDHVTEGAELQVTSRSGEESRREVERVRDHQGRLIIKFKGCETRDDAEGLRAFTIWMAREEIGPLEPGRWFVQDIVGIAVFTEEGEHLGELTEVMSLPANDVYVVKGGEGEILLPATEEVIREVDLERGRMLVHLIEGLRQGGA